MNDRFFEAWITRTWRVCGRKLQPLCLGHLVNLAAVSSPLLPYAEIDESTPVTVGDLLVAVRICSEGFPFRCQLKPRLIDVFWKWLLARSPKLFLHHARLFAAYRHDHCSSPEFWIDTEAQNSSRSISAPIALSKAAFLISNSSLAEERVWSMPLGRVDFLIAAIEERKTGSVRFFDEREVEAIMPPLEEIMSEEEILEIARRDHSPEAFDAWYAARQEWHRSRNAATRKEAA